MTFSDMVVLGGWWRPVRRAGFSGGGGLTRFRPADRSGCRAQAPEGASSEVVG